jgi:hypothetical protein
LVELGVIALGRAAADDVLGRVDKDPVADVAGAGHQFSPVFEERIAARHGIPGLPGLVCPADPAEPNRAAS